VRRASSCSPKNTFPPELNAKIKRNELKQKKPPEQAEAGFFRIRFNPFKDGSITPFWPRASIAGFRLHAPPGRSFIPK
jgi:hypothetical protein